MTDDMSDLTGQDRSRVAIDQDDEVAYWTRKFGVTREELAEAVEQVGNRADAVGVYLGKAV